MAINKLPEFAKDGQKNTDDLNLTDGFPVSKKPARQWFNYLFNMLSLKINEIIESDPVTRSEIVDNLTTNDSAKPLSAKQGKALQDEKLGKTETAVAATKLATARKIGGVNFDGTADINLPGVNTAGNQNTTGNAATATKLQTARTINGVSFDGSGNITISDNTKALLTDFDNLKSQNGYQKLANGIIIQWGYIAAAGATMSGTFPIAFPNACFHVSAQIKHTTYNYQSISINTPSKTGFQLYWDNSGQGIFCFAIGH